MRLYEIVEVLDRYIRNDLFGEPFDPFEGENWKILLQKKGAVTGHIVREAGAMIFSEPRFLYFFAVPMVVMEAT